MSKPTRQVKLWAISERTEKAYLFSTLPKGDPNARFVWLPRSCIPHVSRLTPPEPGKWQECLVEVEEWLADKHDL